MNLNRRGFLKFLMSVPILSFIGSKYLLSESTIHSIPIPSIALTNIPISSPGVTSRIVYRSINSDPIFTQITVLNGSETTYIDEGN